MTEVERVKPRTMAVEEAIQLALDSRWTEAVAVNRSILDHHGPDEDAYNRLGKALLEVGRLEDARESYSHTVEINPLNLIAPKMLRKIDALLAAPVAMEGSNTAIDVDLFTEEPGKSALTSLGIPRIGLAGAVAAGDVVELEVVGTRLRAKTSRGIELGDIDSKIAKRLLPLLASGNTYTAAVARVSDLKVEIILREAFQAPENARKTSFPISRTPRRDEFRPYAKESLLGGRDDDADDGAEVDDDLGLAVAAAEPVDADDLAGPDDEASVEEVFEEDDDDDSRPEDSY